MSLALLNFCNRTRSLKQFHLSKFPKFSPEIPSNEIALSFKKNNNNIILLLLYINIIIL